MDSSGTIQTKLPFKLRQWGIKLNFYIEQVIYAWLSSQSKICTIEFVLSNMYNFKHKFEILIFFYYFTNKQKKWLIDLKTKQTLFKVDKMADLVLWNPAFFGAKPSLIIKGGFIAWSEMGIHHISLKIIIKYWQFTT